MDFRPRHPSRSLRASGLCGVTLYSSGPQTSPRHVEPEIWPTGDKHSTAVFNPGSTQQCKHHHIIQLFFIRDVSCLLAAGYDFHMCSGFLFLPSLSVFLSVFVFCFYLLKACSLSFFLFVVPSVCLGRN